MRTHKLIKTYPGSPPLNSIFKESDKHPNLLVSEDGMSHLVKYYVTNHPEFWEKVEEISKDYEILSLQSKFLPNIIINYENGGGHYIQQSFKTYKDKNHWLDTFLSSNAWNIHSVKRLSDGQIFTIGDKIIYSQKHAYIKSFEVVLNSIRFNFEEGRGILLKYFSKSIQLIKQRPIKQESVSSNFQKHIPKKPLFTTHDKVDMFEGGFCWAGYTYERSLSDYVYGEWSGNGLNMIYFAKKENLITHLNSLNSEIIESEPKVAEPISHKIVSFGPNPRTGGVYTYNKYTDKYHSDISLIQISYKNCLQYPIRSVINTEKNLFKIGDSVNRLNTIRNTEFNIIYFEAVKREKIIYAYIKKQKRRSKLIKVNIDNLEHFVE